MNKMTIRNEEKRKDERGEPVGGRVAVVAEWMMLVVWPNSGL